MRGEHLKKGPNTVLPVCPLTPNIRAIALSQNKVAVIDAEDLDKVMVYRWHAAEQHHRGYFYAKTNLKGKHRKSLHMHQLICPTTGGMEADHRNRNGLDNRKSNLRPATRAENIRNSSVHSDSRSGLKGVSYRSDRKRKWVAQIGCNGKKYNLGGYDTPEEAHEAYLKAAVQLFGGFATNGSKD